MDTSEGCSLPCQMPALGTKGWRERQKPTLSLRNSKERKQTCKPSGRKDSDGHQLTLEADDGRNHCQRWMTSLYNRPGTMKPLLRRGDLVALTGYCPIHPRQPGESFNVDLVQGIHLSGRGAPQGTGLRLDLQMHTHSSLNECTQSRASAYFKSTSMPALQLLHMQQLLVAEGPAPPCGFWQLKGIIRPSASLPCYTLRLRKQKSDQLVSLRFQPVISASSTARRDFAKIHIRQLLRTLLFCLYHPNHAVCLSVSRSVSATPLLRWMCCYSPGWPEHIW